MSSALIYPELRSACRTKLNAIPGLPLAHAFEGFAFTPTIGTPFVEDLLASAGDIPRANGAIEHRMSYIVTLKYPSDGGTADIEAMAGAILDAFKVGTSLQFGSSAGVCQSAARRGAIQQQPEWMVLTVLVTLTAFTLE